MRYVQAWLSIARRASRPFTRGGAEVSLALLCPPQVAFTSDPYWLSLQRHIEGAEEGAEGAGAQAGDQRGAGALWAFEGAFSPEVLARHASAMPAFVVAGERPLQTGSGPGWAELGPHHFGATSDVTVAFVPGLGVQ
jgi:hypothetical protein